MKKIPLKKILRFLTTSTILLICFNGSMVLQHYYIYFEVLKPEKGGDPTLQILYRGYFGANDINVRLPDIQQFQLDMNQFRIVDKAGITIDQFSMLNTFDEDLQEKLESALAALQSGQIENEKVTVNITRGTRFTGFVFSFSIWLASLLLYTLFISFKRSTEDR